MVVGLVGFFASSPTSTNYTLKSYDFGSGGGDSSSTNFKLDSLTGEVSGDEAGSTNYQLNSGLLPTQNANVPPAPTLTNPDTSYSRLRIVLATGNNPTDVVYAIAISSDDFTTTQYVQNDGAIGPTLGLEDYQTFSAWGGVSGSWITGLTSNTGYEVKAKAFQGDFSETGFGPESAEVSTSLPSISFSVATSLSGTPPFAVNFTSLTQGSVSTADADGLLTVSTNALYGGAIYLRGLNSGLTSSSASFTIPSSTTDLASASTGYGGQVTSTSQTSGGPIGSLSPYAGAGDNVGLISTAYQPVASTALAIDTGSVTFRLKAKSSTITPSATDYSDSLIFVASMLF